MARMHCPSYCIGLTSHSPNLPAAPTTAATDMIVEIMVEVLTILAIATKELKRGQLGEPMSPVSTALTDTLFRDVFEQAEGKQTHGG